MAAKQTDRFGGSKQKATDKQAERQTDRQTNQAERDGHIDQTDRQKPAAMLSRRSDGRQSDRQTAFGGLNKNKTGRQTDRQTDKPERQTEASSDAEQAQ